MQPTYWFTADEHYGHSNVIKYEGRPFGSVEEMDAALIANHNAVVGKTDFVVHVGDFCLRPWEYVKKILAQLNGSHIFIKGSHDWWWSAFMDAHTKGKNAEGLVMPRFLPARDVALWTAKFDDTGRKDGHGDIAVTACHYPMESWPASNHGSWLIHGHCHGHKQPRGKQVDVGVDCHGFRPVSFLQVMTIMFGREANPPEAWRGGD